MTYLILDQSILHIRSPIIVFFHTTKSPKQEIIHQFRNLIVLVLDMDRVDGMKERLESNHWT